MKSEFVAESVTYFTEITFCQNKILGASMQEPRFPPGVAEAYGEFKILCLATYLRV